MKSNVLLMGPIGTGKTYSLRTILKNTDKKLFVIATEPGIEIHLSEFPLARCHWKYIPPARPAWDVMLKNAEDLNTKSIDVLQKMGGGNRREYQQFIQLLQTCANFVCDRTGEEFGPIENFTDDCVVAIDGLSGISIMAMDLVAGSSPVKTQPQWGAAMDNLERFITKITCDLQCSLILTSHMDREQDELTGGTKLTVSTLGRKLAPKIPHFFDEVVQCMRDEKNFYWSAIENSTDLKTRRLPLSDKIPADFGPLFSSP